MTTDNYTFSTESIGRTRKPWIKRNLWWIILLPATVLAAMLFLWFLNNNRILYREDGTKRIADGTLVALTLMIAESCPEEKDVMVKVVVNLINKNNQ